MAPKELLDYISQTRAQGFSDEQIRTALIQAGWKVDEIEEGLRPSVNEVSEILDDDIPAKQSFFSKYKKLILVSILVVIILPILAYAGIFSYQKFTDSKAAKEAERQTQIEEQARIADEKEKQAAEREKEAARLRDEQRINDISSIQAALTTYVEQSSSYPTDISMLVDAGQLTSLPFDPDPKKEYLYTPLGDPALHYTLAFILESKVGSLDPGLHVFSSQRILNKDEVLSQDQTIRGAQTASVPDGLILTNLSGTTFNKSEEVSIEISRLDGGELSYVVLSMDNLKLTDRLVPFSFHFTAPRTSGTYSVQIFGFDSQGTSYSGTTTLTVN